MFIFVIQNTIGFYNFIIQDTIQNTWLTHLYGTQLGLINILEEPFYVLLLGSSKFNSPFWCLRDMLLASLLIYVVGWIAKTTRTKVCVLIMLLLFMVMANRGIVVASCLIGSIIGVVKSQFVVSKVPRVMIVCGVFLPVAAFFYKNVFVIDVTFAVCLLFVPEIPLVKNFFESEFVKKIGNISFGIYALHWPVINSVGLGIIHLGEGILNPSILMLLSLFGVLVVTLLLAILFKITVESLTSKVCRKIG